MTVEMIAVGVLLITLLVATNRSWTTPDPIVVYVERPKEKGVGCAGILLGIAALFIVLLIVL